MAMAKNCLRTKKEEMKLGNEILFSRRVLYYIPNSTELC